MKRTARWPAISPEQIIEAAAVICHVPPHRVELSFRYDPEHVYDGLVIVLTVTTDLRRAVGIFGLSVSAVGVGRSIKDALDESQGDYAQICDLYSNTQEAR
jgi:hypothetical protein